MLHRLLQWGNILLRALGHGGIIWIWGNHSLTWRYLQGRKKKKREKETLNQTYGKYIIWSSFSSVYFLFCSQKYYITPQLKNSGSIKTQGGLKQNLHLSLKSNIAISSILISKLASFHNLHIMMINLPFIWLLKNSHPELCLLSWI